MRPQSSARLLKVKMPFATLAGFAASCKRVAKSKVQSLVGVRCPLFHRNSRHLWNEDTPSSVKENETRFHMLLRSPALLCCAAFATPVFSQPGTVPPLKPVPKVGVATIKPSDPNSTNRFYTLRGSHFVAQDQTVANLLEIAYGLQHTQVIGGPAWLQTERFDVEAVPDQEGNYSYKDWNLMLQQILADRFHISCHRETHQLPAFNLTLAKGGPTLSPTTAGPDGKPNIDVKGRDVINLTGADAGIADFVKILQEAIVGRPVIDQTGLAGRYDFTLKFTPDRTAMSAKATAASPESAQQDLPPELFTAMQQQLGLKLVPTKAPAEILIVDNVQHPSQN